MILVICKHKKHDKLNSQFAVAGELIFFVINV